MRGRGLPDTSAVALSVTPAPIIITRRLSFKALFSLTKTSPSRLAASLRASFYMSCCQSLDSYTTTDGHTDGEELIFLGCILICCQPDVPSTATSLTQDILDTNARTTTDRLLPIRSEAILGREALKPLRLGSSATVCVSGSCPIVVSLIRDSDRERQT